MTRADIDKVWALLAACRRGDPAIQDKNLKAAWFLVLEPYDYQDVRDAVIAHFRECKFFPDVGEITTRLPRCPAQPTPSQMTRMRRDLKALRRSLEKQGDAGP